MATPIFGRKKCDGGSAAQRAKFAEKVHKPPPWVNVINFELNGLMGFSKSLRPQ